MAKLPDIMKEEKPFNMAVMWLARLDERLNEANIASVNGDLLMWYRSLRVIYRMVHFKVKEVGQEIEEKELAEKFRKAKENVQATFNDAGQPQKELMQMYLSDLEIELDALETRLNDLMAQYKLVLPDIKTKQYDENIKKFLDIYIKKSVMKKAVTDPDMMKKIAPDLYKQFYELAKAEYYGNDNSNTGK